MLADSDQAGLSKLEIAHLIAETNAALENVRQFLDRLAASEPVREYFENLVIVLEQRLAGLQRERRIKDRQGD